MNRRDLIRFVDLRKELVKRKKEDSFSFFDQLDTIDFRDDLRFK